MRQTILAVLSLSTMAALLTGCGGDMVLLNKKVQLVKVKVPDDDCDLSNAIGGDSINRNGIMVWLEISRVE
jgi:hypothetical protein